MGVEGKVSVEVNSDKTFANVTWQDGHVSRCNVKWLRFHCHCNRCWRAFSGMHPLDKVKFPDDFFIQSAVVEGDDLQFSTDHEIIEDHVSIIPLDWLRSYCNCKECLEQDIAKRETAFAPGIVPRMNYKDIGDNQGLFNLLTQVLEKGFCVIQEVPDEDKISLKIGARIGPIFSSVFQEYFHNESSKDKKPPADGQKLPLHQDFAFYEVQPGVQLLHIRKQSGNQQESLIADLMDAAETLRKESPDDFNSLVRIPATFECKEDESGNDVWYEIQKPHIQMDYFGKIVAVHWHPVMEGPLRVHENDVAAYCKAHKAFSDILKRRNKQIKLKLQPGELLILNNHRMAHTHEGYFSGAHEFSNQTCYINIDDLKSTQIVLAHKLGIEWVPIKVGNRSSF